MTVGLECCIFATKFSKTRPCLHVYKSQSCRRRHHYSCSVACDMESVRATHSSTKTARHIIQHPLGQSEPLLLFFLAYATHPASAMTKKNKKNEMLHMTTTSKRISRNHYATVVVLSGFSEATEHIGTQQTILCLKCRTRERRVPLAGRYLFKDDLRKRKQLSD